MLDLDRWAESVDKEIRQEQESRASVREEFIIRRKLIEGHAIRLWNELIDEFRARCDAFNSLKGHPVIVFDQSGVYSFTVRRDGGIDTLTGTYDPVTNFIGVTARSCRLYESYQPQVIASGDGQVVLASKNDRSYACSEIAENCLGPFIKSCLRANI